ncbi:phytanoyl-CoA dioxygenase family protein [Veronia nyctiphanis]|uniref:phytanoyl-CoA dioxygenase family protein n=1 Tax=Veronia nyctiphanis TaxID=1278244 RepID=UPI00191BDBC8|nr:phytanoyl-CoA dioxygenase family protein [Veronia nyctiphanis]
MNQEFEQSGFVVHRSLFSSGELKSIRDVVMRFHASWIEKNNAFYQDKAINSAFLTSVEHLNEKDREALFQFIGSNKLMAAVTDIMGSDATFMNTQLFFNPINSDQKNYWHRDPQYHLSLKEQKQALEGDKVIHFRIPLLDEPV